MRRFFQAFRHIIWMTFNLLAVVGILLADCSLYLDPARFTGSAMMGLGFEWLLWANLFFALSWCVTHRKKYAFVSLLALLLSLPNVLHTYSHHQVETGDGCKHELTILTYNTQMMQGVRKSAKNEVLRYVKESGADVVCLQEYEVRKNASYLTFQEAKNYLSALYPYTYYDFSTYDAKRQYGLAVYSRYPLENKQTIRYKSLANISNRCDVIIGSDTIRLFTNHLESNRLDKNDLELSEDEMNTQGMKRSVLQLAQKMRKAYAFRAPQVKLVRQEIDASPYPVVVVGDMNDVPVSFTYHTLSKSLKDAFLYSSIGRAGHTFRTKILGVRIDYIFTSPQFQIEWCDAEKVPYSDHFPLSATIAW